MTDKQKQRMEELRQEFELRQDYYDRNTMGYGFMTGYQAALAEPCGICAGLVEALTKIATVDLPSATDKTAVIFMLESVVVSAQQALKSHGERQAGDE